MDIITKGLICLVWGFRRSSGQQSYCWVKPKESL